MRRPARYLLLFAVVGAAALAGAQVLDATSRTTAVPAAITATAVAPQAAARPPTSSDTDWSRLSPQQRDSLAALRAEWQDIDEARRSKWLEVATRLPKMAPEERERIRERMAEWARMSPAERGRTRLQFQESLRFSPDSDDRRARWEAYQSLAPEARQALLERSRLVVAPKPVDPPARPRTAPAAGEKRNIVTPNPRVAQAVAQTVTPTAVQARPGATTTLMSARPTPPAHHQPGLPKIAATPRFVDQATLLPLRGPQGAGTLNEPPPEADPSP